MRWVVAVGCQWRPCPIGSAGSSHQDLTWLLATFQLIAANLRKIRSFLEEETERQRLADGGARSKAYNPDRRRPAFGPHGSTGEPATRPGLPAWFRPFAVDTS